MRECFCVKSKNICLKNWIFNNFQVFSFAIDGRFQININFVIYSELMVRSRTVALNEVYLKF